VTEPPDGLDDDGLARRRAREATSGTAATMPATSDAAPTGEPVPPAEVSAAAAAAAEEERAAAARASRRNILEWVGVIGGAVIIAVLVRTFVFQTFWIPSPSMSPTLVRNDRVLVNKLSYKMHPIHRGDVVVFERPPAEADNSVKDLIKRVVGLPGERVSVVDGDVKINGRTLDEPYTHGLDSIYQQGCGTGDVTGINTEKGLKIPDHHIFVMGDNRVNSSDSRCFGPIDEDLVVGRAFFILWPPSKMGGL
jgi:signal peptidase I